MTDSRQPVKPGPSNEIPPVYEDSQFIVKYVMNKYIGVSKKYGYTVDASSMTSALLMLEQMEQGMDVKDNRAKKEKKDD